MAVSRINTGYSIIIEHLPGVYSHYYHLSEMRVHEGDIVQSGDVIAASGATGLATGPHLHWEVRIAGENADPDYLCARALIDIVQIKGALHIE
jgi:murein DD-endopeptidase MepM/ murein hydrolase activator NlpD